MSPIPQDSSIHDVPECQSFTISEPAHRTDNYNESSFEVDRIYLNKSSERASFAILKDQLDEAFEAMPQERFNLFFNQVPIDPYEFENRRKLNDVKATSDPFLQLYSPTNPHKVQGRLRLKPITPEPFAKKTRSQFKGFDEGNVLDDLKKELNAEDDKLNEGSPAPASIGL